MSENRFLSIIKEISNALAGLPFDDSLPAEMEKRFPFEGPAMGEFSELAKKGLEAGNLCGRENGPLRFSRVCKPGPETRGFSCDAVLMPDCAGPEHTHPEGELSFCIPMSGEPRFDGFGPGWAVCLPGSTHAPRVSGGTMLILYFLPGGSVIWGGRK